MEAGHATQERRMEVAMRFADTISLDGEWKFRTDPDCLGDKCPEDMMYSFKHECSYMSPGYDDSEWETIRVPSCWQAEGYDYNGVAWYRRRVAITAEQLERRVRLRFRGVDYFADVWVNGRCCGSHAGFFAPFEFDVTDKLVVGGNLLVVRVESPNDVDVRVRRPDQIHDRTRHKELIKGALQDWDVNNLEVNPGGIYQGVEMLVSDPVYITRALVDAFPDDDSTSARVVVRLAVMNTLPTLHETAVRIRIAPKNSEGASLDETEAATIPPGSSELTFTYTLDDARLWWTWDLGPQHLYALDVELGADRLVDTFGIRAITKRDRSWETRLNGVRLFFRGTNYLSDQLLSTMTRERYATDVRLMRDANMNMVRPFCVVEKDEFYELCDELGVLVYQDFPIQWLMSDSSRLVRHAVPQARDMVHALYNHPSVIIWCFGSEPGRKNFLKLGQALTDEAKRLDPARIAHQANDCGMFDSEAYRDAYGWSIDQHFYDGWYGPWELEQRATAGYELVSEFGSQSLPSVEALRKTLAHKDLWPMNARAYAKHCFQERQQFRWIERADTLDETVRRSQAWQCEQLKRHIEFYRQKKFAPCNGALQFCFVDCWPAITWSIVDYWRNPKPAYATVKAAFEPLHAMIEWPGEHTAGAPFRRRLFVVNDRRDDAADLELTWTLSRGGKRLAGESITCAIEAGGLVDVGALEMESLDEGEYEIAVSLTQAGTERCTNSYTLVVKGGT